jgi:hypothetical protein
MPSNILCNVICDSQHFVAALDLRADSVDNFDPGARRPRRQPWPNLVTRKWLANRAGNMGSRRAFCSKSDLSSSGFPSKTARGAEQESSASMYGCVDLVTLAIIVLAVFGFWGIVLWIREFICFFIDKVKIRDIILWHTGRIAR